MPTSINKPTRNRRGDSRSQSGIHATRSPYSRETSSHGTLFDVVSGRISSEGLFLRHRAPTGAAEEHRFKPSKNRDTLSHSIGPATPSRVLRKRSGAPTSFDGDCAYAAHRELLCSPVTNLEQSVGGQFRQESQRKHGRRLPESDLLKALHAYASDFYSAVAAGTGRCSSGVGAAKYSRSNKPYETGIKGHIENSIDFLSMDETALLAMGILIEEMAGDVLGQTGDLVFVEADVDKRQTLDNIATESRSAYTSPMKRTGTRLRFNGRTGVITEQRDI